MTNTLDNFEKRISKRGEGPEISEGIPREGFADPTGEYPHRDYYYGTSVNKSARGETQNSLFSGGGDIGVSVELEDQAPSQYPLNQVQETPAGHAIEIDDTPGGERVLIKHKSGAGLELRSDGSVLFSSVNKKVTITGGDDTVIVEGEANLVYKGNVNVHIAGDYNLSVEGNINLTTAGNKVETIHRNHKVSIDENQNTTIKGNRGEKIVGTSSETILSNNFILVKGEQRNYVEKSVEFTSGDRLTTTAVNEWVASSQITNITGDTVSVIGVTGTIGGQMIDHYGKTFGGPPGGSGNGGTTHYGTLIGKATEAITADYANDAGWAKQADAAKSAPDGPAGSRGTYKTKLAYVQIEPTGPMPTTALVTPHLASGNYGIRNVEVDPQDTLKLDILKSDDYDNVTNRIPNIHEIRSKLRDKNNYNNSKFTSTLVAEGRLSPDFRNKIPPNIGRSSSRKMNTKFGLTLLGNNPTENRSKRFKL